jgi:hypothetical protein
MGRYTRRSRGAVQHVELPINGSEIKAVHISEPHVKVSTPILLPVPILHQSRTRVLNTNASSKAFNNNSSIVAKLKETSLSNAEKKLSLPVSIHLDPQSDTLTKKGKTHVDDTILSMAPLMEDSHNETSKMGSHNKRDEEKVSSQGAVSDYSQQKLSLIVNLKAQPPQRHQPTSPDSPISTLVNGNTTSAAATSEETPSTQYKHLIVEADANCMQQTNRNNVNTQQNAVEQTSEYKGAIKTTQGNISSIQTSLPFLLNRDSSPEIYSQEQEEVQEIDLSLLDANTANDKSRPRTATSLIDPRILGTINPNCILPHVQPDKLQLEDQMRGNQLNHHSYSNSRLVPTTEITNIHYHLPMWSNIPTKHDIAAGTAPPSILLSGHLHNNFDQVQTTISKFGHHSNITDNKHVDSFLNDVSTRHVTELYNSNMEISNPVYYQEYLYDDSIYNNNIQNRSMNSTSFELDSNITQNSLSQSNNDENINPIFFHNTPSPNNKNSIRVITESNRIAKVRDKKLVQAIHRCLNQEKGKSANDKFLFPGNGNHNSNGYYKTLNERQEYSQRNRRRNILSSPRKEINDTLTQAIYNTADLPPKRLFSTSGNMLYTQMDPAYILDRGVTTHEVHCNTNNVDPKTNGYESDTLKSETENANRNENRKPESKNEDEVRIDEKAEEDIRNHIGENFHIDEKLLDGEGYTGQQLLERIHKATSNYSQLPSFTSTNSHDYSSKTSLTGTSKGCPKREIKWKHDFQFGNYGPKRYMSFDRGQCEGYSHISSHPPHQQEPDTTADSELEITGGNGNGANSDIVMQIFKESMKKNKDTYPKGKPTDRSKLPTPKITKLRVARCDPEKGETTIKMDEYEERSIYKCAQCPKTFKQRSQWKRHVDCIHLKIAKFVCVKCNKPFKRSDHLKNHIRRIHG